MIVLVTLGICFGKFACDIHNDNAKQEAIRSVVPQFSADFDALAKQMEQNEKSVKQVDRYAASSEYTRDNPLNPFFTVSLKPNTSCTEAKRIGRKYYPILIVMRKKYLSAQEAQSCNIDINNERGYNVISIDGEGIHKGKYCND